MGSIFPCGLPWPTAFYLTMYLLTFAFHQAFMHYVLAGSLYIAWAAIWRGRGSVPLVEQPLGATLRDWMPFLLSAAITAGVAPLLFIQIVYQHQFYTANLLLWWRWMALVPILIIAFYLLYLLKSQMFWNWPYIIRIVVAVGTSICFIFIGFCWTANHLLANSGSAWPEVYVTGRLPFSTTVIALRMLVWIGGSFGSMSAIVGWQLLQLQATKDESSKANDIRSLTGMSIGGMIVAFLAGTAYLLQCDEPSRRVVFGSAMLPYVLLVVVTAIAQMVGWILQWRSRRLESIGLIIVTIGATLCLIGVSVVREGLRINAIDLTSLSERHSAAATVGGFGVFVIAAVIVSLLIGFCIRLVQTATPPEPG